MFDSFADLHAVAHAYQWVLQVLKTTLCSELHAHIASGVPLAYFAAETVFIVQHHKYIFTPKDCLTGYERE